MKKVKILIPVLSSCALATTIAPVITSCSTNEVSLSKAKEMSIGTISSAAHEAMARQPDSLLVIKNLSVEAINVVNQCTHHSQVEGAGYASLLMDAIGRQPEMADKLTQYFRIASKIILFYPDDRGLAIGQAAGGMYDAIARQPQVESSLFRAFIQQVIEII